jgi:hypothetical protein
MPKPPEIWKFPEFVPEYTKPAGWIPGGVNVGPVGKSNK